MRRWRRRPTLPPPVRFWPRRARRRAHGLVGTARTVLLAAILVLIWPTLDPALVEPPAFLSTAPERVDLQFTLCTAKRSVACVVDGDTLRIGKRRIRIVGIDAPEVEGQCPAERELARRSTLHLQSLLNQGPFVMTARLDDTTDRYGRELRVLWREQPGGGRQSIASDMREAGLAARYLGRKASWC